ncbi:MAG: hypothetical protein GY940_37105 [bacterium]|nr:hypothetical protein [bacterium]
MSGRATAIDVVLADTDVIYVGTATGGIWKSINGGTTWTPIFDDQPASSIGALQIFQPNPSIVWAGTGEANPRNSVGVGRGVFKSLDGGKTWLNLGLEKTEKISRICLHPTNPDIAYVASMGTTWGENPERGVYKTVDGGKTWKKILYVDEKTGAADLVMQPGNPNRLIVAMWEHRRWPWFLNSGGPGSSIHITPDGGETWKRLTPKEGLPKGILGRIGLGFAHNKPNIVYALVEAKKDVMLRSEDYGMTWKTVSTQRNINGRPFYYCDIRVNPMNENIVYGLQTNITVSEDGGRTWGNLTNFLLVHSDHHAMWNHPNGDHMITGNDGGLVVTRDRGKTWRFIGNLPVGQFYHISFDMDFPYNVYGGLQDNGSWKGPSTVFTDFSIYIHHWKMVGFGDGFDTEPDPQNSSGGYGMSQGGNLFYFDSRNALNRNIRPTESGVKHRYNWNAGFAIDPLDAGIIYYGSQFVHRSKDKGHSWEIISPDLTTNDPEKQKQAQSGGLTLDVTNAENHTTILSIAPSPVKQGVIWVGTDDGNLQLTRDNGKSWELVSKSITGEKGKKTKAGRVPYGGYIPHVEASKFDAAAAFVVYDDHRRSNWTPYVFATGDYGKTWKALSPDQIDGFVHIIEQDHVNKNLLFLGTEFGLYVSFNGGGDWMRWTHGLPTVPVRDMNIHPRESDLVIGTFGRAVYILDDISPLREVNENLMKKDFHLFGISDAYQYRSAWSSSLVSPGSSSFKGKNRTPGALITFLWNHEEKKADDKKNDKKNGKKMAMKEGKEKQKDGKKSGLKIEVLDKDGKLVQELQSKPKKGLNRISWNLKHKAFERPGRSGRGGFFSRNAGLFVMPGTYTVRFTYKKQVTQKNVTVKKDPRLDFKLEDAQKNYRMAMEVDHWYKALIKVYKRLSDAKDILETVRKFKDNLDKDTKKDILKKATELEKKLKEFSGKLFGNRDQKGISDRSARLTSKISSAYRMVSDSIAPVSQAAKVKFGKVRAKLEQRLKEANTFFETDVENFKKELEKSGFSIFKPFEAVKLEEK